jgi:hypothetical protein
MGAWLVGTAAASGRYVGARRMGLPRQSSRLGARALAIIKSIGVESVFIVAFETDGDKLRGS